jgi:hypothetical protein
MSAAARMLFLGILLAIGMPIIASYDLLVRIYHWMES